MLDLLNEKGREITWPILKALNYSCFVAQDDKKEIIDIDSDEDPDPSITYKYGERFYKSYDEAHVDFSEAQSSFVKSY